MPNKKKILLIFFVLAFASISVYFSISGPALYKLLIKNEGTNQSGLKTSQKLVSTFSIDDKDDGNRIDTNELKSNILENWFYYPSLSISAPIEWDTQKSNINTIMLNKIVHLIDTSKPTEGGDGLIAGHSSYYWWSEGKYKDVFAPLINAKKDDQIIIRKNNKVFYYKVVEISKINPKSSISLSRNSYSKRNLYLMTCVPIGTNLQRLLVKTEMQKFISLD